MSLKEHQLDPDGARPPRRWRSPDPCLLAALGLAVAAKIVCALPRHVCFGDESCYLWVARNLFGGEGYTYYNGMPELHFPPLFPIVLGLFNLLVNDWEVVSRVVYVVFGAGLVVPIYLLALDIYGRDTARIAAFLAALLPAFNAGVLFAETLSEPLYLFCLFFAFYWLYRAFRTRSWSSHALAGLCFSLAYLTRPEAILHVAFAIPLLAAFYLIRRPLPFFLGAGRIGVLAATFIVPALPYVIFLHAQTGEWQLTTKSTTSYTTTRGLVHRDGTQFLADTWGLSGSGEVKYFAHDFDESLPSLLLGPYRNGVLDDVRTNVVNAAKTYRKYGFFGQTLLFVALLGLIAAPWRRRRLASEAYLMAMMLPLGVFTLFFIKDRFLYATLLPLTLWSAQGIRHVLEWIRRTELPSFRGLGALRRAGEVTAVLFVLLYLANTNRNVFAQRDAVRQPDQWATSAAIRKHTAGGAKVMTTMPNLVFHADREWLPLPVAPLPDVVEYGRRRGAAFLVMNRWNSELRPSEQRALLECPRTYPGLELVHVEPDVCAVYRLVAPEPLARSAANGVAEISEPDDDHRSDTDVENLELQRP